MGAEWSVSEDRTAPVNCQKEGLLAVLGGVAVGGAGGAWSVRLCDLKIPGIAGAHVCTH